MYRWVEHTSEVELLIEDESPEAVLTEALVALGELLTPDEPGGTPVTHEVELTAADRPAVLAEWLNELVYLAETDGFIPERVVHLELEDSSLRATVGGLRSVPQNLIKAVTYHQLEMGQVEGEWHARVVLDV